jgi:hypothetical protein
MAQLSSPGVSVTVIDESFYTPAAPGTTPLIIVASAANKSNGAGTGTARGTLTSNAGQVYLLTSQKDLSDTFGTPIFKTDASNNPVHAGEQNEYGLQAAYSFLGVSNRVFAVRADIDLAQLDASADAPAGDPINGTYWTDVASSMFGIFEWNNNSALQTGGQKFANKVPLVITDVTKVVNFPDDTAPKSSFGAIGDYAIVAVTSTLRLWNKDSTGTWQEVGSELWVNSYPTRVGTVTNPNFDPNGTDTLSINGNLVFNNAIDNVATLGQLVTKINNTALVSDAGISAANLNNKLALYSTGASITLTGTAAAILGFTASAEYKAPKLTIDPHTSVPPYKTTPSFTTGYPTGSVWVKTTDPNLGAKWRVKRWSSATGAWDAVAAPIYKTNAEAIYKLDKTGEGSNLSTNSIYVKANILEESPVMANFKVYKRTAVGATTITSTAIDTQFNNGTTFKFSIAQTSMDGTGNFDASYNIEFEGTGTSDDADTIAYYINAVPELTNISAEVSSTHQLIIKHIKGGEIKLVDITLTPIGDIFTVGGTFQDDPAGASNTYIGTLWGSLSAVISAHAPSETPPDGQLWYNSIVDEVDIMIHDGDTWVGYLNNSDTNGTNMEGPQVSATAPTSQSDGVSPLVEGDLWISTADIENYPMIYKRVNSRWTLVDSSDQTTENGILFHDARAGTSGGTPTTEPTGTIMELLESDFLDFDAPDPALYPKGMLLWNLRRSGFNVKKYHREYVDIYAENHRQSNESMEEYYPNRWVSEAANQENGAGTFGRHAQRKVVIQKLQALVNANQQIRDEESRVFNLIACPGYPELIGEMISLNYDRGLTAFVVGDSPARLPSDATSLLAWGTNQALALEDNDDGLVSSDEYLGIFYPWGYTSDNIGNNVVVPPSHMMLRTIALSDNVAYPWFAPAGTRRGGITNATAVGYVDSLSGEFQSVALNTGQRDTLASIKVNPLTFITGTGLVNYGQYTRARNASSLDRINVARLVIYLRRQLSILAKPYVFEPNDTITRNEIKQAAESLMLELVGQRALYDFLVVCDTSNNTPSRIDRSELYLDIAIEPVKAVEFIYIPLRLKNTGEIAGLG